MSLYKNTNKQDCRIFSETQQQINQITNGSLESTRRMVNSVVISREIANETMRKLDQQGEQLNGIEGHIDEIDGKMDQADKHLTNLEKWGGLFVPPWRRAPHKHRRSKKNHNTDKSSSIITERKLPMASEEGMPTGGYIIRITNDGREQEMDDNLQIVHSYLQVLKNTALDMSDTIEHQNKQIDRITKKTEIEVDRLTIAEKRTKKIQSKS